MVRYLPQKLFALLVTACAVAQAVDIQRWKTADGAQVLLVERRELPMVDVAVLFKGAGSAADPVGKDNTASAAASMLVLGNRDWNEEQISEKINDLGASLSGSASSGYASFRMRSLSHPDKLQAASDIFAQSLASPRFDATILQRIKNRAALALQQSEQYPGFLASRALERLNYPDHPYGKSAFQTVEKIQAVQSKDLHDFYRKHYARSNAIIAIVGDIGRERAARLADELLQPLPARPAADTRLPPVRVRGGQFEHLPYPHNQQTIIQMGLPVLKADDPDYFAMLVGNYILGGGGFDSRLMKVLRDQHGYTYGAGSSLSPYIEAGPLEISFATERKNGRAALKAAQKVLADFVAQGPNEEELKQAKAYITGSFPLRFDTNGKLLGHLISAAYYNRPDNWLDTYNSKINALDSETIKRAWQKHIRPEQMNIVVVGGAKKGEF